ncbi:hypothetical protein [Stappia sp.]|uniref:hypothetical protein n=1 Tax=Stappia sp. TaxID=1870903 RepID=UPI0032D93C8E
MHRVSSRPTQRSPRPHQSSPKVLHDRFLRHALRSLALAVVAVLIGVIGMTGHPVQAGEVPMRAYHLANTATLQRDGAAIAVVPGGFEQRLAHIGVTADGRELILDVGTTLRLWRIDSGLARIEWPAGDGVSLTRADVVALAEVDDPGEVMTWGAEVDWPDLGPVTLILFRMGPSRYGGLLSSKPSGVKTLRQMMFQSASIRPRPRTGRPSPVPLCPEC